MSIAVGIDTTSWLQQDASETPADTMPDTTGDLSVFLWIDNLLPAIVLPTYKTGMVWFTTADLMSPDYTDPYVWFGIEQVAGVQAIGMTVGSGSGTSTPFVTSGVEKRAVGITYDGTTHDWKFYIRRTAAWELVGTVTDDWSGNTITQMRLLDDGIQGIGGSISCAYFRLWNGKKLTLDEFEDEATSAVAITAGVTTDTPLVTVDDLTDISDPSGSQWYANGMGLSTVLPGPLAGDVSFILNTESDSPYGMSGGNPTYVCSGVGQTTGSPLRTVTTDLIVDPTVNPTVAICGSASGGWWQATDTSGHTTLLKYKADGTVDRTVVCAVLLCNGPTGNFLGSRNLFETPSGNLLSIIRSSGVLTEVSGTDGTVVTTYSLTITSENGLDAQLSFDGTRLVYLDVTSPTGPTDCNVWDLTNDVDAGTLFTDDAENCWSLVWLADCTLAYMVDTGDSMTPARRRDFEGNLLGTYAYDETTFPSSEETFGIAASVNANRLWMIRDWDGGMSSEQPAALVFNLATTAPIIQVPLVGNLIDYDNICCIGDPGTGPMCVPFPPAPSTSTYPVRRERRLKLAYDKNLLLTVDRIELKMQVGEGTVDVPNPQVMLRASKDGGRTWGNIRTCSGGRMGEYSQRVYWNRFGQGRDWVLEFTVSDPVPWYFLEVIVDVTEGSS